MPHVITLNLRYDWPESDWQKAYAVYQTMPGWQPGEATPSWFGGQDDAQHIVASVEPSGLVLEAQLDAALWVGWLTMFCARLSLALGREVHDAEV
jgi:hypothetical protein